MVTASIVLFNPDLKILKETISSFLATKLDKKLYLIDNSSKRLPVEFYKHSAIEYIFIGRNLGFGKAHNLILNELTSKYHLVLNPDVVFHAATLPNLIHELEAEKDVTCIVPKVCYPNSKFQYVCRRFPSILDYVNRVFRFSKSKNYKHEYRDLDLENPFYPDWVHGCFLLLKTKPFKQLQGFDTRFFLYLEDVDLGKKIKKQNQRIKYFPKVSITHYHQQESKANLRLASIHISSIFKYFLKWGI